MNIIKRLLMNRKLSKVELLREQLLVAKCTLIDLRINAENIEVLATGALKRIAELQDEIDHK